MSPAARAATPADFVPELGAEALRANLWVLLDAAADRTLTIEVSPLGRCHISIDSERLADAGELEVAAIEAVRAVEARRW